MDGQTLTLAGIGVNTATMITVLVKAARWVGRIEAEQAHLKERVQRIENHINGLR